MSPTDAVLFEAIALGHLDNLPEIESRKKIEFSVRVLMNLGLITIGSRKVVKAPFFGDVVLQKKIHEYEEDIENLFALLKDMEMIRHALTSNFRLTEIGEKFAKICF